MGIRSDPVVKISSNRGTTDYKSAATSRGGPGSFQRPSSYLAALLVDADFYLTPDPLVLQGLNHFFHSRF
jgi:hypothetical protein